MKYVLSNISYLSNDPHDLFFGFINDKHYFGFHIYCGKVKTVSQLSKLCRKKIKQHLKSWQSANAIDDNIEVYLYQEKSDILDISVLFEKVKIFKTYG